MKVRLVLLTRLIPAPALTAETRVSVPSDPTAQFFVVGKGDSGSQRTIVTKRVGSSGTYSKRLYHCADSNVQYLGTEDS